ncbi:MAG: COR domain-containing protein [Candidatus Syntropharchaeales archaeon]
MRDEDVLQKIEKAARNGAIALNLSDNQLAALPPEIGELTNMEGLSLWRNQLTTLPPEIAKLDNLVYLDLGNNQLAALPPEIGELTNLTTLEIKGSQLVALPPEITKLDNLVYLDLRNNQLTAIPEIAELTSLTALYLSRNQLTALPPEIGELTCLTTLDLRDNQLTALPPEIAELTCLTEFDLIGNPLPIPPEILAKKDEPATIINYYLQHEAGEKKPMNEAKMLLVGQGSVGKTSLVKRLLKDDFDLHEEKTEGIEIEEWQVTVDDQEIRLNVWDFGGQEIMHATHQFFLTKRSLYLLVLDARLGDEENRIEYWLKIIKSFGGDSPIIIVGNKIDEQPLDIDRRGLMAKYRSIREIVEVSCKEGDGCNELKDVIAREVGLLEHIHDPLLTAWSAVKNRLERMEEDYVPYQEYLSLCQNEGVTDDLSQRTLIGLLHDLGIVLNFRDDPRLEDTNILNPEWVTNGVYRILNSNELFRMGGVLEREMLNRVLDSSEYPRDKHLFITDMMRKFKLCFAFEDVPDQRFLIPDLLPKEERYTGEWNGALTFQYNYDVLPGSIISQFIVRMHPSICGKTYWRSGVVLEDKVSGNKALVKADREDKKIFIWVNGREQTRRTFLGAIRSNFDYIHETIPGIEPEEKVPLPDHPEIVVDYRHLLDLEALGETSFIPEGIRERVNVKKLLNGVEPEEERRERREEDDLKKRDSAPRPTPPPQLIIDNTPASKPANLWITGAFYLVAVAFVMALIAVISMNVSWYALPAVIIGGIMIIALIAILQLMLTGKLSRDDFVTLMRDIFKHLHLLKR